MNATIRHLPANGYRRMPWKNGAGMTTEVAVFPPGSGMDEFDWRLAIADLERSGPFSSFPGVDRLLMMLPPGSATLTIDGREHHLAPLEVVRFRGESAVSASLAGGPARDLNLMTRRGRVVATMTTIDLTRRQKLPVSTGGAVLCAIEGGAEIALETSAVALAPGDSAVIETGAGSTTALLRPADGHAVIGCIAIAPSHPPGLSGSAP